MQSGQVSMIPVYHPEKPECLGNITSDDRADIEALQYVIDQIIRCKDIRNFLEQLGGES